MSLITIILPVYNGEKYLFVAVDSVINQTMIDWKLIISDNRSKDSTSEIAKRYCQKDRRITYIRQNRFLNANEHFMKTVEYCDSPYMVWIASDDVWRNDFLTTCIQQLENNNCGLAFTRVINISPTDSIVRRLSTISLISSNSKLFSTLKYLYLPEQLGKANLIYGIYRYKNLSQYVKNYSFNDIWGADMCFVLGFISYYGAKVSNEYAFSKRLSDPENKSLITRPLLWPTVPLSEFTPYIYESFRSLSINAKIVYILNLPLYLIAYFIHYLFCLIIFSWNKITYS